MNTLVLVVAHPDPGSFNYAIAEAAASAAVEAGAEVRRHDLYADGFDPRMPASEVGTTLFADALTARYASDVLAADAFVVVHPVWFFQLPAIVKGWVDRVLREGVVYRLGAGGETESLLRARAGLVLNTANSPAGVEAALGDPVEWFWRDVVFGFGGVGDVRRVRFAKVDGSTAAQRDDWLAEARASTIDLVERLRDEAASQR